jgi:tetratricopeptide (TPR) repeat protein
VFLLAASIALVGCAKKSAPAAALPPSPAKPAPVDLAPPNALLEAGCYRCLRQAFSIYERANADPTPPDGARAGAFVTAVMLVVREKEIGLDAAPWLDRAAAVALPEERIYLDVAAALPWISPGSATDFEPTRSTPGARATWKTFLEGVPADAAPGNTPSPGRHRLLDRYLLLASTCGGTAQQASASGAVTTPDDPPVIRYRAGLCGPAHRPLLKAVLASDPRFVEASFFIGRYELATASIPEGGGPPTREWLVTAVPPLRAAHDGLPESPVIATVLAGLMRSRGELASALSLYDSALALRPSQRDALLGRTITLTNLSRRQEAIETATRMIDLGTWYLGSAYYYRALNRYRLSQLDSAAADIATARRLQMSPDVMTLSGMIAYDQMRPVDARADFMSAVGLNRDQCTAHWYLGILDVDEKAWAPAVARSSTAAGCFERMADSLRREAMMLPPDLPEESKQQQLADYAESISANLLQAGRSWINAAQASLLLGDRAGALTHARSAAAYDGVKERATSLVQLLGK